MILPGALVLFTPLIVGLLFGPKAIAGLLPGALVSGVQMAISSSNSGGAWDNAKKYIESGELVIDGEVKQKGTEEHRVII
jgi:Na+/H+-translocating membrane pyrophosphatase